MLKKSYIFEFAQNKFKSTKFIFQQDGAKCHVKNNVLDFLYERCNLLCGWPSNSPDLSSIEMMWAIIKNKISKYKIDQKPKTKAELIMCVQKEWKAIDISIVNNSVLSFKMRLDMCIKRGGKSIVPYLKKRKYNIPNEDIEKEIPFTFNQEIDDFLIKNKKQSWKKTSQELGISKNLVKYRTNFLMQQQQQQKKKMKHIKKKLIEWDETKRIKILYPIPNINLINQMSEEEIEALKNKPPVTYDDDSSDSYLESESSEDEE